MMLFFFVCSAIIEKYKPSVGHETTYTILLGIAFSVILYYSTPNATQEAQTFTFKPNFFFNFFLPPIVFNSGFNMRKKMFFKNLGNIAVFGLCVTLVCFVIYGLGGYAATQIGLTSTDYFKDNNSSTGPPPYPLSNANFGIMQVLLYAALLCSSDVVSAVSIVDYTEQPKLFSCIFGEGVANDIVSIILFNTVEHLQSVQFVWYTPFVIIA
jgi:NhaP-type Na+/H+ or K+/H+ antiporter